MPGYALQKKEEIRRLKIVMRGLSWDKDKQKTMKGDRFKSIRPFIVFTYAPFSLHDSFQQ